MLIEREYNITFHIHSMVFPVDDVTLFSSIEKLINKLFQKSLNEVHRYFKLYTDERELTFFSPEDKNI